MSAAPPHNTDGALGSNFLRQIIAEDLRANKYGGRVVTRFPPEPNGYLHIGHAKSICLNFGLAAENRGVCHLRFDDTNPAKEDVEYEDSIKEAVRWVGYDWGPHLYHASDYFDRLYEFAKHFIKAGLAYVDSSTPEEMRLLRGTLTDAGRPSPYRDRPVEEKFEPAGFAAPLGAKDIRLGLAAADGLRVPMPLASLLHDRLLTLLARGGEALDWSAIGQLAARDAGL